MSQRLPCLRIYANETVVRRELARAGFIKEQGAAVRCCVKQHLLIRSKSAASLI